jgi:hypothetical protein
MQNRTGKYKQPHIDMIKKYQPLIYCYSKKVDDKWEHKETISETRGLQIDVKKI